LHVSVSLLQLIETRLADHSPGRNPLRRLQKRSAVAMILQVREGQLHILMIKRAEREGDTWSGHMAFPGGRMDKTDAHGYAVAVRETAEEVGLLLGAQDECIGRLSDVNARPHRGTFGMAVSPFVFRLDREVTFTLNHEVAEVVWVPLEFLSNVGNREEMIWNYKGVRIPVPCYRYEGRCIWGLSLMMLDELLDLVEGRNPRRSGWRRP
jgi:8-oxo-dGTP pyrophosphatase MutT (NUDIX family)